MSVVDITSVNQFKQMIASYEIVALDVYANWCMPCKNVKPLYQQLARSLSSPRVAFCTLDCDLHLRSDITSLPTFEIWRHGQKTESIAGDFDGFKSKLMACITPQQPQQNQSHHQPQQNQSQQQQYGGMGRGPPPPFVPPQGQQMRNTPYHPPSQPDTQTPAPSPYTSTRGGAVYKTLSSYGEPK